MKKSTYLFSIFLGASLLVNVLAFVRLSQIRPERAPATPGRHEAAAERAEEPAPPPEGSGEVASLAYEIRRLRAEIEGLKKRVGAPPERVEEEPGGDPESLASNPEVAALIAERDAQRKLWRDLRTLLELKKSLGDDYAKLILDETVKFLGLDDSTARAFRSTTQIVLQDLEQVRKRRQEAYDILNNDPNLRGDRNRQREVWDRYRTERDQSLGRLAPYLNSSPRHQQFKEEMGQWVYYLAPEDGRWQGR